MSGVPLILIAGEDANDTASLAHLIRALVPDNKKFVARALRRPPILRRTAAPAKRKSMAQEIAALASPFQRVHSKVITVAHRDCDALEPAHITESQALEADLKAVGAPNPIGATPAWEIETWWMLFPDALRAVRGCWKQVNYTNTNVGMIQNAKERLVRDLRPRGNRRNCPDYRETDSVGVALKVHQLDLARNVGMLRSNSLLDFRSKILKALN